MRQMVFLTAIIALGGCTDGKIEGARKSIQSDLYDPESVQFRGETVTKAGAVCGELNAKNKMGGYVGFAQYAAFKISDGWIGFRAGGDDTALVKAICSPDIEQVKRSLLSASGRDEWFLLFKPGSDASATLKKVQALGYPARIGTAGSDIYAGPFTNKESAETAQGLVVMEADMRCDVKQWAF